MKTEKEFVVFCQFSAIAKKVVNAESLEQAKQIVETDNSVRFEEIVKLTEPCKVDEVLLLKSNDSELDYNEHVEYKSWGSE
jgi:hypothetical protein